MRSHTNISSALIVSCCTIAFLAAPVIAHEDDPHEPIPAGPPLIAASGRFRNVDWAMYLRKVLFTPSGRVDYCLAVSLDQGRNGGAEDCGMGVPRSRALAVSSTTNLEPSPPVSHIRGITSEHVIRVRIEFKTIHDLELLTSPAPQDFPLRVFVEFSDDPFPLRQELDAVIGFDSNGREVARLQRQQDGLREPNRGQESETFEYLGGESDPPKGRENEGQKLQESSDPDRPAATKEKSSGQPVGLRAWWSLPLVALLAGLGSILLIRAQRRRTATRTNLSSSVRT